MGMRESETVEVPRKKLLRILQLSGAYIGKGIAEGIYMSTAGGDNVPASLLDGIEAMQAEIGRGRNLAGKP
jgi:hypothetical protein